MSDLPERSDKHTGERFVLKYETPAGSLVELNGYAKFSIIFAAYELLCQARKGLDSIALTDEVRALAAELDQCLTAHAILNDKVCALEQAIQNTLDTGMDRYIREATACPE